MGVDYACPHHCCGGDGVSGRGAVSKIGMTLAVRLETVRLSGSPVWIHERLDHQVEIARENIQHHSGSYDTEMVSPQDHGSHGIFDIHGQGYLLGRDWSLGSWTWDQAERKCSGGLRPPSLFPKDVPRDGCDPWTMWSCSTRLSSVRHRVMSGGRSGHGSPDIGHLYIWWTC